MREPFPSHLARNCLNYSLSFWHPVGRLRFCLANSHGRLLFLLVDNLVSATQYCGLPTLRLRQEIMRAAVGILAASCHLPRHKRSVEELFREEGANFNADVAARLGIEQVPIQNGDASETASNMAVAASREALQRAKVDPLTVD